MIWPFSMYDVRIWNEQKVYRFLLCNFYLNKKYLPKMNRCQCIIALVFCLYFSVARCPFTHLKHTQIFLYFMMSFGLLLPYTLCNYMMTLILMVMISKSTTCFSSLSIQWFFNTHNITMNITNKNNWTDEKLYCTFSHIIYLKNEFHSYQFISIYRFVEEDSWLGCFLK